MSPFSKLALVMMLLATRPLLAQQLPYANSLTEPDQELDNFGGGYASIHKISAQLRGVRGADSTFYWVSADGRQLTAYKRGQQLWQANMNQVFARVLTSVRIEKLIFASNIVFVSTTKGVYAEIDRKTGKAVAVSATVE